MKSGAVRNSSAGSHHKHRPVPYRPPALLAPTAANLSAVIFQHIDVDSVLPLPTERYAPRGRQIDLIPIFLRPFTRVKRSPGWSIFPGTVAASSGPIFSPVSPNWG